MSRWLHTPNTDPLHPINVWYVQFVLKKVMSLLICLQKVITAQPSIALIVCLLLPIKESKMYEQSLQHWSFEDFSEIKVQDLDSRILIYETRDQQLKKTD